MLKELLETWKRVKSEIAFKKKFDAFVKSPLSYDMLQYMIDHAELDKELTVTLSDGTKIEIKKKNLFTNNQQQKYF